MINILIEAFGALTIRNGRRDEEEEKLMRMLDLGKYVYIALGLDKLLPSTKRGITDIANTFRQTRLTTIINVTISAPHPPPQDCPLLNNRWVIKDLLGLRHASSEAH
jgi:hypothetical protein